MKKVIIFGTNKLSEIIMFHLNRNKKFEVEAFTLDDEYCNGESFMGKKLIPFSQVVKDYPPSEFNILITLGYKNMNDLRKKKFLEIKALGYQIESYIDDTVVDFSQFMGEGNIILENCSLGPFCKIGNGNIVYPSTTISHHCQVGDFNFFSIECAVAGEVVIKNNSFFGANCTVRNDVIVEDYTLIGAGTYISKNTEKYGVYVPERAKKLDKSCFDFRL